MVDLPEQVRRQSEAVRAHFQNPEEGSPPAADPETPAAPEATPPANVPEPVQQSSGEQPEDPNSETYQQRYSTLQGIHNADLQRWRAADAERQQRIQQLEQLLAAIPAQPQPQPGRAQPEEPVRYLSDREREEYGESVEVMRKVSREELSIVENRLAQMETTLGQLNSSLSQQIVPQVQQVAQQQAVSAQDMFWRELATMVPNWQQINNDKDFHTWLLEFDPLTGATRQQHLEQAQAALNAGRVGMFFKTFSDLSGKYSSNTPAQPTRSAQSSELERQVAPGRSRSTPAPSPQNKSQYTRADISRFFDDVRKGKYKGQETERNRIERDIFLAQQEGRIVA